MSSAYRMPLDVMRIRPRRLSDPSMTSHPMGSYGKVRLVNRIDPGDLLGFEVYSCQM